MGMGNQEITNLLEDYLVTLGCMKSPTKSLDKSLLVIPEGGDTIICWTGAEPQDLSYYWDIKVISRSEGNLTVIRNSSIDPVLASMVTNNMQIKKNIAKYNILNLTREYELNDDAIASVPSRFYCGYRNKQWRMVYDPGQYTFSQGGESWRNGFTPKGKKQAAGKVSLCVGIAYMLPTFWKATVRMDDSPSIVIPTDPTGVKEMWALRNVPAGKIRRSALLHWVSSHWRQVRNDPDVEAYVRQHMRGSSVFENGSLKVEIEASSEDKVKVDELIQERLQMRRRKADRRRRA
jgi:hypothetical protein